MISIQHDENCCLYQFFNNQHYWLESRTIFIFPSESKYVILMAIASLIKKIWDNLLYDCKMKCYHKQFMMMKLIQLAMIKNFLLSWCHQVWSLRFPVSCTTDSTYRLLRAALISQHYAYCRNFSCICVRHVCKHISLLYIVINTTISALAYFFEVRNTMSWVKRPLSTIKKLRLFISTKRVCKICW